jgi:hypothetical protein
MFKFDYKIVKCVYNPEKRKFEYSLGVFASEGKPKPEKKKYKRIKVEIIEQKQETEHKPAFSLSKKLSLCREAKVVNKGKNGEVTISLTLPNNLYVGDRVKVLISDKIHNQHDKKVCIEGSGFSIKGGMILSEKIEQLIAEKPYMTTGQFERKLRKFLTSEN